MSLVLRAFGEETTAVGLAGGATGDWMEAMLRARGVETEFVRTGGETRLNTVLIETDTLRHTTICAEGLDASASNFDALLETIARHLPRAEAVAVCGSLPASWPAEWTTRLVRQAAAGGRPVVVDVAGECLEAAVEAGPAAIKPNLHELEAMAGGPLETLAEVVAAGRSLIERGAGMVLASLGEAGAVLIVPGGAFRAVPPPVEALNPAGAGDGMVAMLALGVAREWPIGDLLRRAVATGSAITTTPGTAECPAELARELESQVTVLPVGE